MVRLVRCDRCSGEREKLSGGIRNVGASRFKRHPSSLRVTGPLSEGRKVSSCGGRNRGRRKHEQWERGAVTLPAGRVPLSRGRRRGMMRSSRRKQAGAGDCWAQGAGAAVTSVTPHWLAGSGMAAHPTELFGATDTQTHTRGEPDPDSRLQTRECMDDASTIASNRSRSFMVTPSRSRQNRTRAVMFVSLPLSRP